MKVVNLDKKIFEKAFSLCISRLNTDEIETILKQGDDVEKQIAILQLSEVEDKSMADQLILHLTGQDGPIREVTAIKIREAVIDKNNDIFDDVEYYPVFADALCDVNPNICRFVVEFLPRLSYKVQLQNIIIEKIKNIFYKINNPDKTQKNFITVRLFNLYWCLEALSSIMPITGEDAEQKIADILQEAIKLKDYTIDEKVAKIVAGFKGKVEFKKLEQALGKSDNFYVKRYFKEDKN